MSFWTGREHVGQHPLLSAYVCTIDATVWRVLDRVQPQPGTARRCR